jgi:carboxyl-terminal processing protease
MKKLIKKKSILFLCIGLVLVSFSFQSKFFEVAKQIEIYTTLFKELNMYYVNEINPAELTTLALKNTLKNLDPYTNYFNEQDVEAAKIRREGEYGGIGASVRYSKKDITITSVYKGFAADKAGIKPGDVVVKINNQALKDLNREDISGQLLGVPGSEILIEIIRQGNTIQKTLKREKIEINPVPFYQMIDKETGYIVLTRFNEKASSEVKKAFLKLKEQGVKKLILDLRSNPGGLLGESIKISNFFLPKGKVIVSTKAKVKKWSNTFMSRNKPLDLEIPIAVLINGRSASASEIVTGALQDYDRAVVIGERSFGKGLVQRYRPLSYGTQLKVTISKYYTPSGRCIQELDYANRDLKTGKIPKFSDSGVNEFKTQNGRIVVDGGGVFPDVNTQNSSLTKETKILLESKALMNFATAYFYQHKGINPVDTYHFSNSNFTNFTNYLQIDTTFVTAQEKSFKDAFLKVDKKKKNKISKEYSKIMKALSVEKIKAISIDKEKINEALKELILDRYYYQNGVYQNKIKTDKTILKAVQILNNNKRYNEFLSAKK